MTPEKVLEHPAKVLSDDQRRFYFEHGYLHLDGFVSDDWLDRLWAVTNRFHRGQPGLHGVERYGSTWNRPTRRTLRGCAGSTIR